MYIKTLLFIILSDLTLRFETQSETLSNDEITSACSCTCTSCILKRLCYKSFFFVIKCFKVRRKNHNYTELKTESP